MDERDEERSTRRGGTDIAWFLWLGSGFWRGETRLWAVGLTAALIVLTGAALWFQLRLNAWNRDFFDAIERRDWDGITAQLRVFLQLLAFGVGVAVAFVFARMSLQVRWRAWITTRLVRGWMSHSHAYLLEMGEKTVANPEYRIAADVQKTTELLVEFVIGFLSALLMAVAFGGVLLTTAGSLSLTVAGAQLTIPGYMVLAAIAYSLVATLLMFWLGEPLVGLTERRNQAEAELLFGLSRAKEAAEAIALAGGQPAVRTELLGRLSKVVAAWLALMGRQMRVAVAANTNAVLLPIVPLLLLAPKYVSNDITLGQMMQLAAAFGFVVASLNWFFDNFPRFAEWTASVNRVVALHRGITRVTEARDEDGRIRFVWSDGPGLRLADTAVTFEDGRVVVADADLVIRPGESVLLTGESGSGKSILVRALAGIWPWGAGAVHVPRDARMMVVTQSPYMPEGSLRTVLCWPRNANGEDDARLVEALADVGLGHMRDRLDVVERWDQTLTEGDKQRLSFARALAARPDILVLDEATGALEHGDETALFQRLRERLPALALLTVGRQGNLAPLHDRVVALTVHAGGARTATSGATAEPSPVDRRTVGWWPW